MISIAAHHAALDSRERTFEPWGHGRGRFLDRESGVADRAQRIAQFMRDRRRQLPKDAQSLFAHELMLRGVQFRRPLLDAPSRAPR